MSEPVARIQSIVFGGEHAHAYRYADGRFYPLPVGGAIMDAHNVSVPAVVIRADGASGVFSVAKVGLALCVNDIIRTAPECLLAIEFLIGGRVGVNASSEIQIVNERSVANLQMSAGRKAKKFLSLWFGADAGTLKQPIEIQTNGGVLGIRG
jgi:hypothetical protein